MYAMHTCIHTNLTLRKYIWIISVLSAFARLVQHTLISSGILFTLGRETYRRIKFFKKILTLFFSKDEEIILFWYKLFTVLKIPIHEAYFKPKHPCLYSEVEVYGLHLDTLWFNRREN